MQWLVGSGRNNLFGAVLVASAAALLSLSSFMSASAISTDVGVTICGSDAAAAQVDITQPVNDSVLDQPDTTFRGTVASASQLEVAIDGQYSATVSVGPSDGTFQFNLSIPAGTHTVSISANALCGGQNASDSVVVSYTPAASQPSTGGSVPTAIEGQTTLGGEPVVQVDEPESENSFMRKVEQVPVIGGAVGIISDFASAIGLASTVESAGSSSVAGAARVGVTVAALTSVVMAGTLAPVAAQAIPGISELFNVRSHRSMIYLGWVIRGIGVLAMSIAYFL